jgi:hypothetical protein
VTWGLPLQLEDIAMDFPDLKMIIAHLGHPWEQDMVVLIRKCPNLYAFAPFAGESQSALGTVFDQGKE